MAEKTEVKQGYFYTEDHDWVKVDGNIATIGVSDYAQHEMGEVVYVELPEEDDEFSAGDDYAVIEPVKAASDSYLPISGKIVEINEALEDSPEQINEKPYETWLVKVEMTDAGEIDALMDSVKYEAFIAE